MALDYVASREDLIEDWIGASVSLDRFRSENEPGHLHKAASILCRSLTELAQDRQFWADLREGVGEIEHGETLEQVLGDFDELLATELEILKHVMPPEHAYRLVSEVGLSVRRLRMDPDTLGVEQLEAGSARLGQAVCESETGIGELAQDAEADPVEGSLDRVLEDEAQPRRRRIVQALQATTKGVAFLGGAALVVGNAGVAVGTIPLAAGGPPGWAIIATSFATGGGAMNHALG